MYTRRHTFSVCLPYHRVVTPDFFRAKRRFKMVGFPTGYKPETRRNRKLVMCSQNTANAKFVARGEADHLGRCLPPVRRDRRQSTCVSEHVQTDFIPRNHPYHSDLMPHELLCGKVAQQQRHLQVSLHVHLTWKKSPQNHPRPIRAKCRTDVRRAIIWRQWA